MKKWIFLLALCGLLGGSVQADIVCGDMDLNGGTDIADIVYLVDYMFTGGPPLLFPPTADCDGDGQIDISDLVCWVDCWFVTPGGCTPLCPFEQADNHTDISGGCLPEEGGDGSPPSERGMYLEAVGNNLHVYHPDAYYQCCLGYYVQYYHYGNHFVGFEIDTGELCDCYCWFNLESVIHDLSPGEYVVALFGIEGALVGVDTAVIETGVVDFNVGECVPPDPKGPPEEGDPIINYNWSAGVLTMFHENAWFNCGAILELEFEIIGDTLRFHEKNTNEMVPVPCMCFYELTSVIEGIPPGSYVAEVYNQDYPWLEDLLLDRQHISVGQGEPELIDFEDSGCLPRFGSDDTAIVNYYYGGDTLTMAHLNGFFNCGGIIEVEFSTAGDTLRFWEFNISDDWQYCLCYFEVNATVINIAPGSYVAEVYARDQLEEPIVLVDRQTIMLEYEGLPRILVRDVRPRAPR